jgi:glycerol-3-phosphate dehydrogenase
MKRDLRRLAAIRYDLLVVGAGIHGACIARDAALRGLRVALVDQNDFGNATSHNSFKLIHGGLRYLQHLDLRRVRESLEERRFWLRAAPHLVRLLKFVMPTYGHGTRGPEALWLALRAHDAIGFNRNRGVPPSRRAPAGRVISKAECLRLIPDLAPGGLTGGAIWYDGQMEDADRVLLECVLGAAQAGADVVNYLAVEELIGGAARVEGVRAHDTLEGTELEIRAAVTVNACGPWSVELLRRAPSDLARGQRLELTKGMNLVTRRLFDDHAVGVTSRRRSDAVLGRSERLYFVTPWYDCSVIGTAHLPYEGGNPDRWRLTEEEVESFLDEINAACPAAGLTLDAVRYCYGGLTPADGERGGEVKRARRSVVIDHQRDDGMAGLITVVGVKYTTARRVAEHAVDVAFGKLGRRAPPCTAGRVGLPGAEPGLDRDALAERIVQFAGGGIGKDGVELLRRYGAAFEVVLNVRGRPRQEKSLRDIFQCCCLHGVREEMAVRLKDLIFLRTNLAARGALPDHGLSWCADMMQAELGWSSARRQAELAEAQAQAAARFCSLAALSSPSAPLAGDASLVRQA